MTAPVTLTLGDDTLTALDAYAARVKRPRDELVEMALKQYVALQSWQLDRIEAGIAAADRGDFASDDDVAKVFAGYGVAY